MLHNRPGEAFGPSRFRHAAERAIYARNNVPTEETGEIIRKDLERNYSAGENVSAGIFENRIYTVEDAARLANVCCKTIYRLVAARQLRVKRLPGGRSIRILGSELIGWMKGGNHA